MKPTYEELEAKCQLQQDKLDAINKLMGVIESASDLAKDGIESLEQQLSESRREFTAANATIHNLELKLAAVVAENAGLKAAKEIIRHLNANREEANFCGIDDCHIDGAVAAMITPATDAFLAEVRASAIPDGYKLVPEHMYLDAEDVQAISMQCGNGDKKGYGDYEDGILWIGELSNDGELKYGLNIANANYPEEGSITVFEFDEPPFAAQLRQGAEHE